MPSSRLLIAGGCLHEMLLDFVVRHRVDPVRRQPPVAKDPAQAGQLSGDSHGHVIVFLLEDLGGPEKTLGRPFLQQIDHAIVVDPLQRLIAEGHVQELVRRGILVQKLTVAFQHEPVPPLE